MAKSIFRGFSTNMMTGQKRGAVSVSAKNLNKNEEGIEVPKVSPLVSTLAFGQCDLFVSNGSGNKAQLEMAKIIKNQTKPRWSAANIYKLTAVNWGSRSIAGFINFAAIGFMGDYCTSFVAQYSNSWLDLNNLTFNKFVGGMAAGTIACMLTQPFNYYADHKLLGTRVTGSGRLLTQSPMTLFSQFKSTMGEQGIKLTLGRLAKKSLEEFTVRAPRTALTFGLIHVLCAKVSENLVFQQTGGVEIEQETTPRP